MRTITEYGKTLFCGCDVAKALGYKKPQNAIAMHCKGALKRGMGVQTGIKADGSPANQQVEMLFIPEGDVYRLAAKSELPGADEFERWIFDEVLPAIRETGTYSMQNCVDISSWHKAAAVANVADRAMKIQGHTPRKRALQIKKILEAAGVPLIPDFMTEEPQVSMFDTPTPAIQIGRADVVQIGGAAKLPQETGGSLSGLLHSKGRG